jgi:hypothetical protein
MKRRHLLLSAAALAALSACSGPYTIRSEVSSFGNWPAERQPGSYAFERMPSQQQQGARQTELEEAARAGLEKAGFKPAADAKSADVLVTLGVRVSEQYAPWDDPLWWRWGGNINYWRYGAYWRPYGLYGRGFGGYGPYGYGPERRYDREVALLLRDRSSSEPLYEARASSDGLTVGDAQLVSAMFEAAMSDFPRSKAEPHSVGVVRVR